jgi:uncharacterized protein YhaN
MVDKNFDQEEIEKVCKGLEHTGEVKQLQYLACTNKSSKWQVKNALYA